MPTCVVLGVVLRVTVSILNFLSGDFHFDPHLKVVDSRSVVFDRTLAGDAGNAENRIY